MISIKNLNVEQKGKVILQHLTGQFEQGQVHGIVGLNGAGKTTFLNSLYGFIKPTAGEITYQEKKLSKKYISYLETSNYFYAGITGGEYLKLFCKATEKHKEWNKLFLLPLNNLIESYSTGMKKKLALMGVLLQNKPILLLDEPFNGLDLESMWVVKRIISDIKHTKTILLTSHILETLTDNCDFIHRLEHKKINQVYAKEDFKQFQELLYQELHEKTALQ
ncbi:ATP-binding cassette domain-containing protein [Pontibacter silvestris]|uniref:ATP-binding cassette domain-containing protein n=1 Tax=Pontibacter silvestris TaxID=2305183 RepID=A0ABW4X505_9BACT|nr:ABC transporter ATP-binding protein [Pontibacter silvestris]MCC9137901.1 ABC transporter ATP-binding protein [Pontibacter silvestris]